MKSKVVLFGVVAMMVVFMAIGSSADPLTVGGGWTYFDWYGGPGVMASPSFTLTTTAPATIQVTDGYVTGDQFAVYVNSLLTMTTSMPVDGLGLGLVGDAAWADARYSHGCYIFNTPGTYQIDIKNILIPTGAPDGGAHIRALDGAVPCVPEPGTILAAISILGPAGFLFRRRA